MQSSRCVIARPDPVLPLRPDDPKAVALMAGQVAQQAEMLAMIDVFQLITWSFLVMLPLVFLLRRSQGGGAVAVAAE